MDWTLVSNNVKFEQAEFLVLDLNPETLYTLRMTAHNSAGSTVANYDFITLTFSGAIVAPELIVHSGYGRSQIYHDLGIIIPTVAGFIILIVSGVGFFLYIKRRQELFSTNKYGEKPSEIGLVTDLDKAGCEADANGGGSGSGVTCASPRESVYLPTPMRVSLGRRQDISPYATFRVPSSAVGSEGSSEGTVPVDQPQNQLSERYGSSAESVYTKIRKKSQYENEVVDWIPLHSLYQSHRY